MGSGDNHWYIWSRGVNLLQQLETVNPRHSDIGNYYLRLRQLECLQQIIAIFKALHFYTFTLDGFFHHPAQ